MLLVRNTPTKQLNGHVDAIYTRVNDIFPFFFSRLTLLHEIGSLVLAPLDRLQLGPRHRSALQRTAISRFHGSSEPMGHRLTYRVASLGISQDSAMGTSFFFFPSFPLCHDFF